MKIKSEIPLNAISKNGYIYTKDSFTKTDYEVPLFYGIPEEFPICGISCINDAIKCGIADVNISDNYITITADTTNLISTNNLSLVFQGIGDLIKTDNGVDIINKFTITGTNIIPTNECAIDGAELILAEDN